MDVTFVFNHFDLVEHFVLLVFLLELLLLELLGLAEGLTGGGWHPDLEGYALGQLLRLGGFIYLWGLVL